LYYVLHGKNTSWKHVVRTKLDIYVFIRLFKRKHNFGRWAEKYCKHYIRYKSNVHFELLSKPEMTSRGSIAALA